MNTKATWWYSLPPSSEVAAEFHQYYSRTIFPHYRPTPYVMYSGPANASAGPPDGEVSDDLCACVLGDSTVADPQLCRSLELAAAARQLRCRFHNRGVVAANSGITLSRMLHQCVDERPDLVIVVGGGIDILTPLSFDPRPGYPHIHFVLELLFEHFFDPAHNSLWAAEAAPLSAALLRERFFDRIAQLRRDAQLGSSPWEQQVLAAFENNVRKMFTLAAAFGFKLLFVLQPLLPFKDTLSSAEVEALPDPESIDYIGRQYKSMADILTSKIRLRLDPMRARIADCHDLFRHDRDGLFTDLIHYDTRAAGLLADAIISRIEDWLDGPTTAPGTAARASAKSWIGRIIARRGRSAPP